jgi:ElaB/YqjD/DUF883 family membrane-anchored ribosome-binding protein
MAAATQSRQTRSSARRQMAETESAAMQPIEDFVGYLRDYTRKNPETAALVCLGIGFVLGWRLKPW